MATSTIQASGVNTSVNKPKALYDVTTADDLVGAFNDMCNRINVDRGMGYYSLRTIDLNAQGLTWMPAGNWMCFAFTLATNTAFWCVLAVSPNQKDMYLYRCLNRETGHRYIEKIEGTNVKTW